MNKSELVDEIAQESGLSKADAHKGLDAFMGVIEAQMKAGETVQLVGFGNFEPRQRAPRKARNLQTGEMMDIPAQVSPVFKPSKSLKERINKG